MASLYRHEKKRVSLHDKQPLKTMLVLFETSRVAMLATKPKKYQKKSVSRKPDLQLYDMYEGNGYYSDMAPVSGMIVVSRQPYTGAFS